MATTRWSRAHDSGRFLGELNLLTGLRVFVTATVVESGELIAVPAVAMRRALATEPALSDKVLAGSSRAGRSS